MTLAIKVADNPQMLLLAISVAVRCKSALIEWDNKGGKANHDKKDTKNPNHDKWKTLPYLDFKLKIGMVIALLVRGLTSGSL